MDIKRNTESKRDLLVELLRIIGCIMVVGVHVRLKNESNGIPDVNRIFISSVLVDGVNLFWMILGFFLFTERLTYGQRIQKSLKRIVLPLFLYNCFTFYFADFLFGGQSLLESFKHTWGEYQYVFCEGILKWRDAFPYGGHLWFMYIYFAVIVCSPAICGMGKIILKDRRSQIIGFILLYLLLVVNDITCNGLLQLSYFSVNAVVGASFYILLGGILYHNKDKITRSIKFGTVGVALFVGTCLVRTLIYYYGAGNDQIMLWYSSFGVPEMMGLCLMVFGFGGYINWGKISRKMMIHFGKMSMYIYFFHAFAVCYLIDHFVFARLEEKIARSWYGDVLYTCTATAMVIGIALVISEILYWLKHIIIKIVYKTKSI